MGLYDFNDMKFSWNGDYSVGPDGDLGDTSEDMLLSLRQELHTVVKSELMDWEMDPLIGAGLSDFIGEPNTREVGGAITQRIKQKILEAKIVETGDLDVKVVPVSPHEVLIIIGVSAMATVENKLVVGEKVTVNFLFDSLENSLFYLPIVTSSNT